MNLLVLCGGLIAALVSGAWGATSTNPLVEGNTAFALQLYGRLRTAGGNLALSPFSISSALAMTWEGARGETARQMADALQFTAANTNLPEAFKELNGLLLAAQRPGGNILSVANSL